jgi:hypothetical protein
MGTEYRRLHPETIVRVLYRLRAEIIREGQDGLEHVDALLRLRGANPEAKRVPPKVARQFGRGKLRLAILRALRDGPRTGAQIAAAVAAERGLTAERARAHAYPTLSKLRAEGHVCAPRKDNRGRLLWELAP